MVGLGRCRGHCFFAGRSGHSRELRDRCAGSPPANRRALQLVLYLVNEGAVNFLIVDVAPDEAFKDRSHVEALQRQLGPETVQQILIRTKPRLLPAVRLFG